MNDHSYTNTTESLVNNYIWFRNPKVASTTILLHLKKHTKICYSKRRAIYEGTRPSYDESFKFAFVRNPWERLVSFYTMERKTFINKHGKVCDRKPLCAKTFDAFIERINNDSIDLNTCNRHFRLQTTLYPINDIDFLGRFENFKNDFNFVCTKLRITTDWGHRKRGKRDKPYTEYYNSRTKKIVERRYAQDIELLKYKFGG